MTREEARKIKVGDVVGAIVQSVGKMGVWLETPGEEENRWVPLTAVVSHTPAPKPPLKVGDRVKTPLIGERTVIWIDDDLVWLSPAARGPSLPHHLSEIELWERLS